VTRWLWAVLLAFLKALIAEDQDKEGRAKAYRATRKEVDHADDQITGDDPDLARRWLHERDQSKR
jgi:hypothetical protein